MKSAMMLIMALIMTAAMLSVEALAQPPPIPAEEQLEVLTRGPVNEAFAQPVNLEDQTGFIALTAPPPGIEEVPPAERPAGEQFAWVPGYWAWDSDRNGYIWVSGCWRAVPPDMYWVPGYWTQVSAGWQWVAGFWAPVSNEELEYLPPPPALTIEEPPPPPQFASDRIWVPPCWYWNNGQYILRSGYWIAPQPDWVWAPSHYVWTPRGYVFAAGHWDYSLDRRGVLFAPVYIPRHIYERRGYSYPLSIIINIDNLQLSLFSRPQFSHYYFGDYYDSSYISIGIFPWFQYEQRRTWYDPIYAHARWRHHRDEPQWEQRQRREYDRRVSDVTLRPPRTYREMKRRGNDMPAGRRRDIEIAVSITQVVNLQSSPFKFEENTPQGRAQISKDSGEIRKFGKERRQWESKGHGRKIKQADVNDDPPSMKDKEKMAPENPEGWEMRPSQDMKRPPAEHKGRDAEPNRGQQGERATESLRRQPSKKVPPDERGQNSPREREQQQVDRVKVLRSPVVDRQRGVSHRKGLPPRPDEEMHNDGEIRMNLNEKPSKKIKSAPAERKKPGAASGKEGEDATTSPKQLKSKNDTPQETEREQWGREEVLTPPGDENKDNREDNREDNRRGKGGGKGGGHR